MNNFPDRERLADSATPSIDCGSPSDADMSYMQMALALAANGEGAVEPNPMVGCVLVAQGRIIGRGFHAKFGEAHAERMAIADCERHGNAWLLPECTAYVTLEPCAHEGKTPPCTQALVSVGVRRVVAAMLDPFPAVAGKGCDELRRHGISVEVGVYEAQARRLNAPYLKRLEHSRPWVIAKWAMSLDGKIATRTGHSQWISCEESRELVHQLRGRVDAILVGRGTVAADNPQLTARPRGAEYLLRTPMRVVIDSLAELPTSSRLAQSAREIPLLLWCGPESPPKKTEALRSLGVEVVQSESADANMRLDELLRYLAAERHCTNVLVEGGGRLLGSLLELGQIDQCEVFIAPILIGGQTALSPIGGVGFAKVGDGSQFETIASEACGIDTRIRLRRR